MKVILFGMVFLSFLVFQTCAETSETEIYLPKDWKEGETKCPVHNEILKKDTVKINYSLIKFKEGYLEAKSKQFPFANTRFEGGDIVGKAKNAVVVYCDQCRLAQKKWTEENKNTPFEK